MRRRCYMSLLLLFLFASAADAGQVSFNSVGAVGTYNNSLNVFADGYIPPKGTQWQTDTVWWQNPNPVSATHFTFDMGVVHLVQDIVLSVDNNDSYRVDYSANGSAWSELFTISSGYGDVGWGMDTMSTVANTAEYLVQIDFPAVGARYLRIYAVGGDNMYSVGEFKVFGNPNATPLPATLLLLASGLVCLAGFGRRLTKTE